MRLWQYLIIDITAKYDGIDVPRCQDIDDLALVVALKTAVQIGDDGNA